MKKSDNKKEQIKEFEVADIDASSAEYIKDSDECIKKIIELGKSKGVLTYKEIMEAIDDTVLRPDQLEHLYEKLEELNVDVTTRPYG